MLSTRLQCVFTQNNQFQCIYTPDYFPLSFEIQKNPQADPLETII